MSYYDFLEKEYDLTDMGVDDLKKLKKELKDKESETDENVGEIKLFISKINYMMGIKN